MASSFNKNLKSYNRSHEQYFINDIRMEMRKFKNKKKLDSQQLFVHIQSLSRKITFLNERVDYLNQKVGLLKKEMTRKIEIIHSKVKKIHKRLFFAIAFLTTLAIAMLIIEFFILAE